MDQAIWQIVVVIVLILASAIFKAIQDVLQFHFTTSIFQKRNKQWWNPSISWKNKHEWFKNNKFMSYLIQNPLVGITDAWHFFGFLRNFLIYMTIPIISQNYWFVLGYLGYAFTFHAFYTWAFRKKDNGIH